MTVGTWAGLRGVRVGLWGIGVEGRASLRRLRADGVEPVVVVDRAAGVLEDGTAVVAFDAGGGDLLAGADVVVKSPGISRYGPDFRRVAAGAEVVGGLGLWLAGTDASRVACVTGTKGKSTTTSIAGGLLAGLGCSFGLGGNIGTCPWDPDVDPGVDWWVIETSSYQVPDLRVGPKVVAVTSLSEDHLPWHGGSAQTYYTDKLSLCTRPGVAQVVANGADALLRAHARLLGPAVEWVEGEAGPWAGAGPLLGAHNRRNAEIARRTLRALGVPGMDDEARLAEAFRAFVPLPSRLTPVARLDGVDFVDDSISTNVLSATAAVASFPDRPRVGLLVGGLERDIDYRPLAAVADPGRVRVFTMPTNGPAIAAVLRGEGLDDVVECTCLDDAVRAAFAWTRPDGVVLLSPAAASFDLFADYRARGQAFTAVARSLAG